MAPKLDLDRPINAWLRVEHLLYFAVLAGTLLLRVLWLDNRPLHHDESIHAYYSARIVTVGLSDYKYDPVYHGPTLYYGTAIFHALFGASDFTSRLLPVFSSLGLVALGWALRPFVGRGPALVYALLVALSPTLAYYGRSLRHDLTFSFFQFAAVLAFLHYLRGRDRRLLYLAGAMLGLAATTKEDIYLSGVVFAGTLLLLPLWGDPEASPFLERVTQWSRDVVAFVRERWISLATAILVFSSVYVVFYTSLLTHTENWNATRRALEYWWGQQKTQRIGGPWWYYLPLEVVYEPIIFFGAVATLVRWRLHGAPSRAHAFFGAWAILSFAIYAWAQEKVPWLLVPFLVPQAVLAAETIASLSAFRLALVAPVGILTVWSLVASNYLYDAPHTEEPPEASHEEPLVYVQSTYDVRQILGRIESVATALGTGKQTPMVVVGEPTWPLSWYLREYPVHWGSLPAETQAPILVMDIADANRLSADLAPHYERQNFAVRGWWMIDWGQMTIRNVFRFLVYRLAWNPPGTTDGAFFVARDLTQAGARPLVRLKPAPPVRSYASGPVPVTSIRTFGDGRTFSEPRGLAFDLDGNLLVVDTKNHRIVKLDRAGAVLETWGGPSPGAGPREFQDPCGIAVARDGSVYVADTWNHRIQKLDPRGNFQLEWREENPAFWGPRAVAVAPDGTVFVADTGNKRVLGYDANGRRLVAFGKEGTAEGELVEPVGLAIDSEGTSIYVADTGNHRIQRFALDGTFQRQFIAHGWQEFYTEPYLAFANGKIWATDSFNHRVNAYDLEGNLEQSLGGPDSEPRLQRPVGIAVSGSGEVYVSDVADHRILVLPAGAPASPVARSP